MVVGGPFGGLARQLVEPDRIVAKDHASDLLGTGALEGLPLRETHGSDVYAIGGIGEPELDRLAPYRDRISGIAAVRLFQESEEPRAVVERIEAL